MAVDLNQLQPEFRTKLQGLLDRCRRRGYEMRPYCAVRDPFEQARLWRQSRSSEEIKNKLAELRAAGAGFLAQCLESVGPQHGDPVTNALPGLSWHQWGEAADCFWVIDGRSEWSTGKLVNGMNGYRVYAEEAPAVGLTAGGNWTRFKDWPHVQLRPDNSPLGAMSLADISRTMEQRFRRG